MQSLLQCCTDLLKLELLFLCCASAMTILYESHLSRLVNSWRTVAQSLSLYKPAFVRSIFYKTEVIKKIQKWKIINAAFALKSLPRNGVWLDIQKIKDLVQSPAMTTQPALNSAVTSGYLT